MDKEVKDYYWGKFDVTRIELAELLRKIANDSYDPNEDYCGIVVILDDEEQTITLVQNLYLGDRRSFESMLCSSEEIGVITVLEIEPDQRKPVMIGAKIFSDNPIFWQFISTVEESYTMFLSSRRTVIQPAKQKFPVNNTTNKVDDVIFNASNMKTHFKNYSPATAKVILDAIPKAWKESQRTGNHWGPGIIGKTAGLSSPATSRYLGAFVKAGLTHIEHEGETIIIPYRSHNALDQES